VSATPLAKKLGLHPHDTLVLIDAPQAWSVPDTPAGVLQRREAARTSESPVEVIVAFFRDLQAASDEIPVLAPRIFPTGAIWAAWPRRAGGHDSDITERHIRAIALALGLVDVKVAALDEDWSGLRLVWRRELRKTSRAPRGR
jgi:hypothetical protein